MSKVRFGLLVTGTDGGEFVQLVETPHDYIDQYRVLAMLGFRSVPVEIREVEGDE